FPRNLNHIFASQTVRFLCKLRVLFWSKYHLGYSFPVAQIDKYDAAMIAGNVDPAGEGGVLADVALAKCIAIVRPVHGHAVPDTLKNFATLSSSESPQINDY